MLIDNGIDEKKTMIRDENFNYSLNRSQELKKMNCSDVNLEQTIKSLDGTK